ncbi:MAG: hypothetical protein WCJ30_04930 [Deltaproteobacteria bacterium]
MRALRRAFFVLVALGSTAPGCHREPEDTPETVLSAWVSAMNASRSDVDARRRAYPLLSSRARDSLTERAARASQLSGRDVQPWEMLAPGRFAMRFAFDPDGLEARVEGEHATVTARGRSGDHAEVPMVREQGHWRVDLTLPAMEPIQSVSDAGAAATP